jgi:hypothetical protein
VLKGRDSLSDGDSPNIMPGGWIATLGELLGRFSSSIKNNKYIRSVWLEYNYLRRAAGGLCSRLLPDFRKNGSHYRDSVMVGDTGLEPVTSAM